MKTTIFRLFIMIIGLFSFCSLYCNAEVNRVYSFMIYEYCKEDYDELGNSGERSTGKSGICTISSDAGMQSSMLLDDEVESYEIWDKSGESLIARCSAKEDFLNQIELFRADCQIKIITEQYIYIGYPQDNQSILH